MDTTKQTSSFEFQPRLGAASLESEKQSAPGVESAIPPRQKHPAPERSEEQLTLERASRLPGIMRKLGVVILLTSAVVFAGQGVVGLNGFARYMSFLGFTAALTAIGVFCGIRLREDKGARTLFGVSASFLPAHFAALGSFLIAAIYGVTPGLPEMFTVNPVPNSWLLGMFALALPILVGTAYAGFSALARTEAKLLTALFLGANALLLLPTRDGGILGAGAMIAVIAISLIDLKVLSKSAIFHTTDGTIVRAIAYSPVAVLIGRQFVLYPIGEIFVSAIFATVAGLFFSIFPSSSEKRTQAQALQFFGIISAVLSWVFFAEGVFFGRDAYVTIGNPNEVRLLITFLPTAVVMAVMSFFAIGNGRSYRTASAWIAIVTCASQLFNVGGVASSFLMVLCSVVVMLAAFTKNDRELLAASIVGFACGIVFHLRYAYELYAMNPWLFLAVLGVTIIVGSSYLERNGRLLIQRFRFLERREAE